MAWFDPTLHPDDLWLPVIFLLGLGYKAYRVPFLEKKLDATIQAFSAHTEANTKAITDLAESVAELRGSFDTIKEINFGPLSYKSQSRTVEKPQ